MQTTMPENTGVSATELESSLLSTLDRMGKALTVKALRTALPKPFQRDAKVLTSMLERLVAEQRAFKVGSAKSPAYARRDPALVAEKVVLAALADGPTTEKVLTHRVKQELPGYALKPLLLRLTTEQRIHPEFKLAKNGNPTRSVARYALGAPPLPPRLTDVILGALEAAPRKPAELKQYVKARVGGMTERAYTEALNEVVATRRVFPQLALKGGLPAGKVVAYARVPQAAPGAHAFIAKAVAELDAALRAARGFQVAPAAVVAALIEASKVDPAAVWAELVRTKGVPAANGVDAAPVAQTRALSAGSGVVARRAGGEGGSDGSGDTASVRAAREREMVFSALTRLIARERSGALIPIRRLRGVMDLDAPCFDAAVLALADTGKVILHHHDLPGGLSDSERAELVRDAHGTYYVGIALRRGS